jgi:hypothetical protein
MPAIAQEPSVFVRPYWWDKPVVEGLGRAMMDVAPNRARFEVSFVETDNQSAAATKKAVARARLAYDAIRKVAGDKARVTTSVNVNAYFEQYRDKDGNILTNDRADRVKGYEARTAMTVTLTDTDLAGRARAAALALAPQNSGEIYVYLEETAEMQRDILNEAAKDARERARGVASAAGAKLGDLLVIQEGSDSCMGNWSTGQAARVMNPDSNYRYAPVAAMASPAPPPPAPVASGMIDGRQVTITEADLAQLNLPNDELPRTISANVCVIYTLTK